MAKFQLRPSSDVTKNITYPAGTHYTELQDITAGLYVGLTTGTGSWYRDLFGFTDHPALSGTITKVSIKGLFSNYWYGQNRMILVTNSNTYTETANTLVPPAARGGYSTDRSWDHTVNPQTGLAWTWDEINSLQAGFEFYATTNYHVRCFDFYIDVEYTPAEEIQYSRDVVIAGQSGAGTNFQVLLRVGESSGSSNYDFHLNGHSIKFPEIGDTGDVYFTTTADVVIPMFVNQISGVSGNRTANIWLKIPEDLGTNKTIKVKYGKDPVNRNSGSNVFIEFYDATTINSWTLTTTGTVSYGICTGTYKKLVAEGDTWSTNSYSYSSCPGHYNNAAGMYAYYKRFSPLPIYYSGYSSASSNAGTTATKPTNLTGTYGVVFNGYIPFADGSWPTRTYLRRGTTTISNWSATVNGFRHDVFNNITFSNESLNLYNLLTNSGTTIVVGNIALKKTQATEPSFSSAGTEEAEEQIDLTNYSKHHAIKIAKEDITGEITNGVVTLNNSAFLQELVSELILTGGAPHDLAISTLPTTQASLVCGVAGALANFQAVARQSNDASIKMSIDGVLHENILLNLVSENEVEWLAIGSNAFISTLTSNSDRFGQTFTTDNDNFFITKISKALFRAGSALEGTTYAELYATSGGKPTGSPLATDSMSSSLLTIAQTWYDFEFNYTGFPNTMYAVVFRRDEGGDDQSGEELKTYRSNGSVYSGGAMVSSSDNGATWGVSSVNDLSSVNVYTKPIAQTMSDVVAALQEAIRTATGETESVTYDTDHFVITSSLYGKDSKISYLQSPSSGTDISGSSYLNGQLGGTAVATNGDFDYLNAEVIPFNIISWGNQAKLTCGTAGLFDDFVSLSASTDDGTINMVIDSVQYNNIRINLTTQPENIISNTSIVNPNNQEYSTDSSRVQSFSTSYNFILDKIAVKITFVVDDVIFYIKKGTNPSTATTIGSVAITTAELSTGHFEVDFSSQEILIEPGEVYFIVMANQGPANPSAPRRTALEYSNGSGSYGGGSYWNWNGATWTSISDNDYYFSIDGKKCLDATDTNSIRQTAASVYVYPTATNYLLQSFTTLDKDKNYLESMYLHCRNAGPVTGYTFWFNLYLANTDGAPIGSSLKQVVRTSDTIRASIGYDSFPIGYQLEPNTKYCIVISTNYTGNMIYFERNNAGGYAGGEHGTSTNGSTWSMGATDMNFYMLMSSNMGDIASIIQKAIRSVTGKHETVTYNTDHFEITSAGQISKMMAVHTGTDLSGTDYLNGGANGVVSSIDTIEVEATIPSLTDTKDNYIAAWWDYPLAEVQTLKTASGSSIGTMGVAVPNRSVVDGTCEYLFNITEVFTGSYEYNFIVSSTVSSSDAYHFAIVGYVFSPYQYRFNLGALWEPVSQVDPLSIGYPVTEYVAMLSQVDVSDSVDRKATRKPLTVFDQEILVTNSVALDRLIEKNKIIHNTGQWSGSKGSAKNIY